MYISEIIWKYHPPKTSLLTNNYNPILLYTKGNKKIKQKYKKRTENVLVDDDGEYCLCIKKGSVAKTMAKRALNGKSKHKKKDVVYKDGEPIGVKQRDMNKAVRYFTVWDDIGSYKKMYYPTEKPFKLLERIICLSTK